MISVENQIIRAFAYALFNISTAGKEFRMAHTAKKSCRIKRETAKKTGVCLNHITKDEIEMKTKRKKKKSKRSLAIKHIDDVRLSARWSNSEVHKSPKNLPDRIVVATLNE